MKEFNVLVFDINSKKPRFMDVIPYFVGRYTEMYIDAGFKNPPETFKEFKKFIRNWGMNQFWSRCEYEILINGFPPHEDSIKMDVYDQIMANLDLITQLVMESIHEKI